MIHLSRLMTDDYHLVNKGFGQLTNLGSFCRDWTVFHFCKFSLFYFHNSSSKSIYMKYKRSVGRQNQQLVMASRLREQFTNRLTNQMAAWSVWLDLIGLK